MGSLSYTMFKRLVVLILLVGVFLAPGCGDSDEADATKPQALAVESPVDVAKVVSALSSMPPMFDKVVRNPGNGSVYALSRLTMPVLEAKRLAASIGAYLLDIEDKAEQAWLSETFPSKRLWLGLERVAVGGDFAWQSGVPIRFTNWNPGEPNNGMSVVDGERYAHFGPTGTWWDISDSEDHYHMYPAFAVLEFKPGEPPPLADRTATALRTAVHKSAAAGTPPLPDLVNALAVYRPEGATKGRLKGHALLVAVGNYLHLPPLSATVRDMECLAPILMAQGFSVTMMTDKTPEKPVTAEAIAAKLQAIATQAAVGDTLIFCFSGHGFGMQSGSRYLNFLCHAAMSQSETKAFSVEAARDIMESPACKADKRIIVIDACRSRVPPVSSGAVSSGAGADNSLRGGYNIDHLRASRGTGILFAATPGFESVEIRGGVDREGDAINNGLFTHFVVKGLRGRAENNNDGFVTFHELAEYLAHRMKEFSEDHPECRQKPFGLWDGGLGDDIAIVDLRGGADEALDVVADQPDTHLTPSADIPPELAMLVEAMGRDYVIRDLSRGFSRARLRGWYDDAEKIRRQLVALGVNVPPIPKEEIEAERKEQEALDEVLDPFNERRRKR